MGHRSHYTGPVWGTIVNQVVNDLGNCEGVGANDWGHEYNHPPMWCNKDWSSGALGGVHTTKPLYPGVLAHCYSINNIAAGTPDLDFEDEANGGGTRITNALITGVGANSTGYGSYVGPGGTATRSADIVGALGEQNRVGQQVSTIKMKAVNAATEGFVEPFHQVMCRPFYIQQAETTQTASVSGLNVTTSYQGSKRALGGSERGGDWRNFITTLTLPTVSASAASGTNQVARTLTSPMKMRVIGCTISYTGSATGNTCDIFNSTRGLAITNNIGAGVAGIGSTFVPSNNLSSPEVNLGDVIQVRTDTSGTAISGLSVQLTVVPLEVAANTLIKREADGTEITFADLQPNGLASTDIRSGGLANIYMAPATIGASQADALMRQVTLPFDCTPLAITWSVSLGNTTAGHSWRLRNQRTFGLNSLNLINESVTMLAQPQAQFYGSQNFITPIPATRPLWLRGDNLHMRGTTPGGGALTNMSLNILVRVQGFTQDNPALD